MSAGNRSASGQPGNPPFFDASQGFDLNDLLTQGCNLGKKSISLLLGDCMLWEIFEHLCDVYRLPALLVYLALFTSKPLKGYRIN
jgi:hypothetical protein